jgi:hypothetical protein
MISPIQWIYEAYSRDKKNVERKLGKVHFHEPWKVLPVLKKAFSSKPAALHLLAGNTESFSKKHCHNSNIK